MSTYIESATFDIFPGALAGTMSFRQGLNLLSGENGTFKTKLLQALRSGATVTYNPAGTAPPVQAISPRRNAQRRAVQQIYNELRRNDTKLPAFLNVRDINDAAFEVYPSLGDLFYVVYSDLCRDGGNQVEKMNEAATEFNGVIRRVFEHYELQAVWDDQLGAPQISLIKNGMTQVPLEGLSLGEQEILSLATYIHSSRNSFEVFLIDEPEVHLNWHLEEKLFDFLNYICEVHDKQMIVVTHSRVVFTERFLPKTTFLFWESGQVRWGRDLTAEQRRRLAGEAIEIVKLGDFTKPTFFVEDVRHAQVIQEMGKALAVEVLVYECGSKSNVRSLYRLAQGENWRGSYFVEDGDNEGSPFNDPHFIHLDKYCMECYLLDPAIAATVWQRSEAEIRRVILDAVKENRGKIFQKAKPFEFLVANLTTDHITGPNIALLDASIVFGSFLRTLGYSQSDYVRRYVQTCQSQDAMRVVLPSAIVDVIETAFAEVPAGGEPSSVAP